MEYMYVDEMKVPIEGEKNILEIVRKAGIELPTFCYYSELSTYGACRMCVVENERGGIEAACSTLPRPGMRIKTNTPALHKHRSMILELLLAAHCRDCTTCSKTGKCRLQELAYRFGIHNVRFADHREEQELDTSSVSLVRNPNKCILCGDCVRVCQEKQNVGVLDFAFRGSKMRVMPAFNRKLAETDCVNCGQCSSVCPTGAITVKDETTKMWHYINDPSKFVVVQIAPAVRVGLGDEFGCEPGENILGKLVHALKMMGVDRVYDTSLGADLTVVEEAHEFMDRLSDNGPLPMFTSCCPAWIKYAEQKHPELINRNISSCRSPMQMFSAVTKEYFRNIEPVDGKEIVNVAIMPCTAKKYEAQRPEFIRKDGSEETDLVLTTQEIARMIRNAGINFNSLGHEYLDGPFDMGGSGAGVIFGVTGGVSEAVLRYCASRMSIHTIRAISDLGIRGKEGIKEAVFKMGGLDIKLCVVHGLANAEKVIQGIESGEMQYDLVEVMACPEGCIGGAGQPFAMRSARDKRAKGLYSTDDRIQIKYASKNPMVDYAYKDIILDNAHELLHVRYGEPEEYAAGGEYADFEIPAEEEPEDYGEADFSAFEGTVR